MTCTPCAHRERLDRRPKSAEEELSLAVQALQGVEDMSEVFSFFFPAQHPLKTLTSSALAFSEPSRRTSAAVWPAGSSEIRQHGGRSVCGPVHSQDATIRIQDNNPRHARITTFCVHAKIRQNSPIPSGRVAIPTPRRSARNTKFVSSPGPTENPRACCFDVQSSRHDRHDRHGRHDRRSGACSEWQPGAPGLDDDSE
jgi:hypothetical protein